MSGGSPDGKRHRCEETIVLSDSDDSVLVVSDSEACSSEDVKPITGSQKPLNFCKLDAYLSGSPEFYNNDSCLPIFERILSGRKRLYLIEEVVRLLLHPTIQSSRYVCTKVPTSINQSVSFVVDVDQLENRDDVLSDDMGVWKNNGVDTTHVKVSFSGAVVASVEKCSPPGSFSIKRVYRTHGTDKSLKKLTAYINDSAHYKLALIVYKFDGVAEHDVLIRPHGNAKSSKPYRRTKESTKVLLKAELQHSNPKEAVDTVYSSRGGVLEACSAGDLPRGRAQAYNIKRKMQEKKLEDTIGQSGIKDMLYVVMEQCKSAEKSEVFVQDVTCAPEPMAVLCTQQQLNDIYRFCCDPYNFCILGIDPTFNLGEFSVTPTVYRHLLLQNTQSGHSPLLLGPLLVHYRKQFRNYNYFLSTLIGLQPEISSVKAVGTDGEKNLVEAVLRNFPFVTHIRCFRHLQQNVEMHLRDHQFSQTTIKKYIQDIFGWSETNGTYHEGLVDSHDASSFDESFEALKVKWDQLEMEEFSNSKFHDPGFHSWFRKYKAEDFRQSTLRSLREDLGLGSPPRAFYTNDSESINALLKESLGYKKQQWGMFNEKMKNLVHQQQREVEKAVIGYGEHRLRPQFSFLKVREEKWFRMSQDQRLQCLQKFNSCAVTSACTATSSELTSPATSNDDTSVSNNTGAGDITIGRFNLESDCQLTVTLEDAVSNTKLPYTTIEGIWNKASTLVLEKNSVVPAPGFGAKDKMVKSKSGTVPHLVSVIESSDGVIYKCDDRCLHFKSIRICSHCVAAADLNQDLENFLQSFRRSRGKNSLNLSTLSTHGMPAGVGRKGGKAAKKKAPRKRVVAEENRVPLGASSSQVSHHSGGDVLSSVENFAASSSEKSSVALPDSNCSGYPPSHYWPDYNNSSPSISSGSINSPYSIPFPASHFYQSPSWQWPPVSSLPWNWSGMAPSPHTPASLPPTPAYHASPSLPSQHSSLIRETFKVCFKVGNISVCSGCRTNFSIADQIVFQHCEFRNFNSPRTGLPTSKYGNAYYHVKRQCVELKWGSNFEVVVADSVQAKLTSPQKGILLQEFNIRFNA